MMAALRMAKTERLQLSGPGNRSSLYALKTRNYQKLKKRFEKRSKWHFQQAKEA